MIKTFSALAAAAVIAGAAVATPTTAEARCYGCGVAAGVFGGLALGALIGSAAAAHGPYGYYGPGPYYAYGPQCWLQRQRVRDGYGWRVARVRVCR